MNEPLTPERVTEIRERADRRMEKCRRRGQASLADLECTKNEVHELAAETDRLRAELGSKAPAEASGGRTGWVRDTLIAGGLSVEHADRVMAEVRAEHLNEGADALEARVADVDVDTRTTWAGMDAAYLRHLAATAASTVGDKQLETSQPDRVEHALRMPNGDVWLTRHIFPHDRERLVEQGAVLVQRTVRYGAWTEATS